MISAARANCGRKLSSRGNSLITAPGRISERIHADFTWTSRTGEAGWPHDATLPCRSRLRPLRPGPPRGFVAHARAAEAEARCRDLRGRPLVGPPRRLPAALYGG